MTHTYALLDVSRATFTEVARLLRAAAYHHSFDRDVIDMHGIALRAEPDKEIRMPRKQEINAKQILAYFKTAPMENARLVLDLAKGEVQSREPKKATTPPARPATPAAAQTTAASGPGARPRRATTQQAPPAGSSAAAASGDGQAQPVQATTGGMAQV